MLLRQAIKSYFHLGLLRKLCPTSAYTVLGGRALP